MITYKFNKLGLAYKVHSYSLSQTILEIEIADYNQSMKFSNVEAVFSDTYYAIDWGDTTLSDISQINSTKFSEDSTEETYHIYNASETEPEHIYTLPGRYLIKLKNIKYFTTSSSENSFENFAKKITGIYQLGTDLIKCNDMFLNNINLTYLHTDVRIPKQVTDCQNMFNGCINLQSLPTYLLYCDRNDLNITTLPNEYDTLNRPRKLTPVTNYTGMFKDCHKLRFLHTYFQLADSAQQVDHMFQNCYSLTTIRRYI